MPYLKNTPYQLLLLASLLLGIVSFFATSATIDINLHDAYYLIPYNDICLCIAGLLFFQWLLYLPVARLPLSRSLTWLHLITTLLPVFVFLYFCLKNEAQAGKPTNFAFNLSDTEPRFDVVIYISATAMFFIAQLFFVANLIRGMAKRNMKAKNKTPEQVPEYSDEISK